MNREDIIRMAREADREWDCDRDMVEWLEWFASLVAAAEREACADIADAHASIEGIAQRIAAAIRGAGMTTKIVMKGVREYCEGMDVRLEKNKEGRWVIDARNECGHNSTEVDLLDLLKWLKTNEHIVMAGSNP